MTKKIRKLLKTEERVRVAIDNIKYEICLLIDKYIDDEEKSKKLKKEVNDIIDFWTLKIMSYYFNFISVNCGD